MLADQMCVMLYVWLATSTINGNTRFAGKAPLSHYWQGSQCYSQKLLLSNAHIHLTEKGPDMVVEGARLPSILRLASCLSALVTLSPFFGISAACCDCSGE